MHGLYAQAALATFNICLQMFKYIVYLLNKFVTPLVKEIDVDNTNMMTWSCIMEQVNQILWHSVKWVFMPVWFPFSNNILCIWSHYHMKTPERSHTSRIAYFKVLMPIDPILWHHMTAWRHAGTSLYGLGRCPWKISCPYINVSVVRVWTDRHTHTQTGPILLPWPVTREVISHVISTTYLEMSLCEKYGVCAGMKGGGAFVHFTRNDAWGTQLGYNAYGYKGRAKLHVRDPVEGGI